MSHQQAKPKATATMRVKVTKKDGTVIERYVPADKMTVRQPAAPPESPGAGPGKTD